MRKASAAGSLFAAACVFVLPGAPASAQTAANVAVVINENSPDSIRIGEHYITRRSIPAVNVVRISVPAEETIDRAAYTSGLEAPLARALTAANLQDRILYIVLTKGVPLRITGAAGQRGTAASVGSELTLLYRRKTRPRVAACRHTGTCVAGVTWDRFVRRRNEPAPPASRPVDSV